MKKFEEKIETLKKECWKREATIDFLIEDFKISAGERDFRDFVKAVESAETEQFKSLVNLFENLEVAFETSGEFGVTIEEFIANNFFSDTDYFEKKLKFDGVNLAVNVPFFNFDQKEGWEWVLDTYLVKVSYNLICVAIEKSEVEDLDKDLLVWTAEVLKSDPSNF